MIRVAFYFFAFLGSAGLISACSATLSAHDASTQNAGRGDVFAFLPSFVIDTARGRFMNRVRGSAIPMHDCSDATQHCLRSSQFAVTFPRSCDAFDKFITERGSGGTRIATSYEKNMHHFNMRMYLLVDDRFPHYGFIANKRGIRGIIYNPVKSVEKVATAAALAAADGGKNQEFVFSELVSAVPMMKCEADT